MCGVHLERPRAARATGCVLLVERAPSALGATQHIDCACGSVNNNERHTTKTRLDARAARARQSAGPAAAAPKTELEKVENLEKG